MRGADVDRRERARGNRDLFFQRCRMQDQVDSLLLARADEKAGHLGRSRIGGGGLERITRRSKVDDHESSCVIPRDRACIARLVVRHDDSGVGNHGAGAIRDPALRSAPVRIGLARMQRGTCREPEQISNFESSRLRESKLKAKVTGHLLRKCDGVVKSLTKTGGNIAEL